jgi:hypothetical protein
MQREQLLQLKKFVQGGKKRMREQQELVDVPRATKGRHSLFAVSDSSYAYS